MSKKNVDLLVVGAGATGSCVAYEASKRGLKVALLDAGDIGCGTSCRSTKLLHGGVRYLELAFKTLDISQLRLVREALLEREHWLENTPFLARRLELALPTESCLEKSYYRVGLGIYDTLSGIKNTQSSRLLSKYQLLNALPLLKDELNGGVAYSDGQFDDSRLNLLLALTAEKAGAILQTRCRVVELTHHPNGRLSGAISENLLGERESWEAKAIVNATGINVDRMRQLADRDSESKIIVSRGVHLVLKENLCPSGLGLILPATDDGRIMFVLPFFGHTQVGTTDIPCDVNTANHPSSAEIEYLTSHVQRWFPTLKSVTRSSCWAGGRPLLKPLSKEVSSSRLVREHEIETLPCGLISAMGGKWTTCRKIALDALQAVEKILGRQLPPVRDIPILGSHQNPKQTPSLLKLQQKKLKEYLPDSPVQSKQVQYLQSNYGLNSLSIIGNSSPEKRVPLSQVIPICEAEIEHSIQNEHALTPTDILARRCRLAMVDLAEAQRLTPIVQDHLNSKEISICELNLED